ncbi:zinc finger protein 652-like [Portunus trituberculatus]|uniref:zinc finger protein 652-like n=1 Tax=Portunus trituberculatus TaxID=210409 RepID=UPI001E1CD169|nr:zinc finger protein 652-like [Portunus trituberculatus]XP_045119484.1 zinc finger protein 652-like [Portunus trituberculatus]
MDFEEQRRLFAITINNTTPQQQPQPQQPQHHTPMAPQHTPDTHTHTHTHTRLLMPNHMEAPIAIHHSLPQHHILAVGGAMVEGAVAQDPTTSNAAVVEKAVVVEGSEAPLDVAETVGQGVSCQRWCLVCDRGLPAAVEERKDPPISLHRATMTISQRKLSAMLSRLVGLATQRAHSDVLCGRCFGLVEKVDGLEIELADTKMELMQHYESTVAHRQPSTTRKGIERPSLEVDVDWEESNDSEPPADDLDNDPDCLANGSVGRRRKGAAKKVKRKGVRPRKVRLSAKVKQMEGEREGEGEGESEGQPRKRGRGRPRKKDKEEDEMIPPGAPTKECPSCRKVVHAKKYLTHLSTHRLFPCPFCDAVFKRKDIKTHLAEAHQEEIHYPCTECDEVFDTFMQLRTHCLVVHMGVEREEYACKTCGRKFSSLTGLKVHVETIHEKSQVHLCPECKEPFNQKGNMQNHYRRVHQGQEARKLLCHICTKGFICPSDLRKHIERVHLKIRKNEVMCEVCGKPFSDSRAMRIHINAVHTREVQHPCPECKMVFHSLTNMVTHRRRMHGGPEGRRNVCEVCGKGFCSPSDLKTHVRVVHDNVRKYVCDICGQAFKVCSHLKYHRRKHTGEAPYECPHCGKCFHGPSHISDHVKKVHKTVYIGTNQRRKLNLPDSAPPPPPGMLPPRDSKPKLKPASPPLPTATTNTMPHTTYSQPMPCSLPTPGITTFTPAHHTPTCWPHPTSPAQPPYAAPPGPHGTPQRIHQLPIPGAGTDPAPAVPSPHGGQAPPRPPVPVDPTQTHLVPTQTHPAPFRPYLATPNPIQTLPSSPMQTLPSHTQTHSDLT